MGQRNRLFCVGFAMSLALIMVQPAYAVPTKEYIRNEINSEISGEEKLQIAVSDTAIEAFKQLQSIISEGHQLLEYGYNEVSNMDSISTGDLLVIDGKLYICIKQNKENTWWTLEDDTLVCSLGIEASGSVYHKNMNQTAHPTIEGLIGYKGDALSTVALPQNYKWVNEETTMSGLGKKDYPAMYIPEDFVNDKAAVVWINVEVKPHLDVPEIGEKYTVKYVPHLTAEMAGIPEGWKVNSSKELEMGDNHVTATYKFPDGTAYTEKITITVEKGEMNINGVMITVVEDTKISNNILPVITNGKLEFTKDLGKAINKNTNLTCMFIPDDKEHYNNTNDIPVIVNVVPKSIIKHIQPSKDNDTEQSQTQDNTKDDGTGQKDDTGDASDKTDDSTKTTDDRQKEDTKTDDKQTSDKTPIDVSSTKKQTTDQTTDQTNNQTTGQTTKTTTDSGKKQVTVSTTKNTTDGVVKGDTTVKEDESKKVEVVKVKDIDLTGGKKTNESKIKMNDIDLTQNTTTKKKNETGKVTVEMIDLTKKHTDTDASEEQKTTEQTTEVTTEELTTTEVATSTDRNSTESTEETAKKEDKKKDGKDESNLKLMIIIGATAMLLAGAGIIIFRSARKNKMR